MRKRVVKSIWQSRIALQEESTSGASGFRAGSRPSTWFIWSKGAFSAFGKIWHRLTVRCKTLSLTWGLV